MDFTSHVRVVAQVVKRRVCFLAGLSAIVGLVNSNGYAEHLSIDWNVLSQKDGITAEGGFPPNSTLKAFRGTAIIDAPIGLVISVLFDHSRAPEWVDALEHSVELGALESDGVLVWQQFSNPWPVMDRIFIYRAQPEYSQEKQFFRAKFIDVDHAGAAFSPEEHSHIPDSSCCVIGKIIHAEWQFRATSPQKTCARVTVIMDPKGWVPAVFVNWFQETWPQQTLAGFRTQVKKPNLTLHPDFGRWSASTLKTRITSKQCQQGHLER